MSEADLIFNVGARFDDRITNNPKKFGLEAKKIHIDSDPSSIDKIINVDVALQGDAKLVLSQLCKEFENSELENTNLKPWWDQINEWKEKHGLNHDMLNLENSIGRADAIVLSGGSAFGLDACSEIQDLLRQDEKGYKVGKAIVPLVPGAVIFDLNLNDKPHVNIIGEHSPWRMLANKAYKSANTDFLLGSFGAGCGATTATLKGGQGSSSWSQTFSNGKKYTVGAIVINNAVGNPLFNEGPHFLLSLIHISEPTRPY